MIGMYCSYHHSAGDLCSHCKDLLYYAYDRIENCVFGKGKPVCLACNIHCFGPEYKEKIRHIMRFSGPKMIFKYPGLAILHLIDKHKKAGLFPGKKNKTESIGIFE